MDEGRVTPIPLFSAAAATWQNFYLLVGTAAATLAGLMFLAITFGSELVTPDTSASVRSFLDPTFNHFVHVLLMACLMVVPTMGPTLLGVLLLLVAIYRVAALFRIYRHMREAHRIHQDIELSDWLSGIVIPLMTYLLLGAASVGFVLRFEAAFDALAIVTLALLLNGVFGAWELMVWLALTRTRRRESPRSERPVSSQSGAPSETSKATSKAMAD
jgi:hypothetical protein